MRMDVNRLEKKRAVRKWIPALSILLNLFISGNPVKGTGERFEN
jgi:hypothetical protein